MTKPSTLKGTNMTKYYGTFNVTDQNKRWLASRVREMRDESERESNAYQSSSSWENSKSIEEPYIYISRMQYEKVHYVIYFTAFVVVVGFFFHFFMKIVFCLKTCLIASLDKSPNHPVTLPYDSTQSSTPPHTSFTMTYWVLLPGGGTRRTALLKCRHPHNDV